jgi:hypothetical protein
MSFPDTFVFRGKRTTMSWEKSLSQYYQIGNAVCPTVAAALARSVMACLLEARAAPSAKPRVAPLRSLGAHPAGASPVPDPISVEVERRFEAASQRVLGLLEVRADEGGRVTLDSISVPAAALPAALLVATERVCPVCRRDLEPLGTHDGTIPFLISKDDVETLLVNENEHGLDYHLRSLFGVASQCGHVVGEALSRAGLATLVEVVNPRTGRKVRGMTVARCPSWVEALRPVLFDAVRAQASRRTRVQTRRVG